MNFNLKNLTIVMFAFTMIACNSKKTEITIEKVADKKAQTIEILVGTYTNKESKGIYKLAFNPIDGTIVNEGLVAEIESPSYLSLSIDKQHVYAVGESEIGYVSVFKWNTDRTKLELVNNLPTEGIHPCFVEVSDDKNLIAVANYSSGNISVFQIDPEGKLLESPQIKNHKGNSIIKPNQDSPHAHCSKFSNDGKFIYVADLGIDEIVGYSVDENNKLSEKHTALKMDAGDGPRHFIYHPTKEIVYIISEFSNSVTVASINTETGVFTKIDKQSTLPKDFEGDSYGADIQISSNGKFLYASNRGPNSIAIFSVSDDGLLKLIGTESVRGDWPRNFTMSPNGEFLLVANQKSNNITVFKVNRETGLLTFTGHKLSISMPVCLKF